MKKPFKNLWAKFKKSEALENCRNIKKLFKHAVYMHMRSGWHRYPKIGHPYDQAPIMWQTGTQEQIMIMNFVIYQINMHVIAVRLSKSGSTPRSRVKFKEIQGTKATNQYFQVFIMLHKAVLTLKFAC